MIHVVVVFAVPLLLSRCLLQVTVANEMVFGVIGVRVVYDLLSGLHAIRLAVLDGRGGDGDLARVGQRAYGMIGAVLAVELMVVVVDCAVVRRVAVWR
jgi:hypothetical protein